jgi:L-alanine-DL-glutamate epimerase-like enolase superfamily enzyme
MKRREILKAALASVCVMPRAIAQEVARRSGGLPPMTIKDVRVITTSGGRNYRWVFLKVITTEPGLYGICTGNNNFQTRAVIAALQDHLKPWLIGKDADRIETSGNRRRCAPTGVTAR